MGGSPVNYSEGPMTPDNFRSMMAAPYTNDYYKGRDSRPRRAEQFARAQNMKV